MRVLVLGSGAREHALTLALARDPSVTALSAAPGNPGIANVAHNHDVDIVDPSAVAGLAERLRADLVVVGPEAPLVAGVADAVRARGIACFGPSARAAKIEASKTFGKEVMGAAGVPTAHARICTNMTEIDSALDEFKPPYVVKHDGLAAGKGVLVTTDLAAARAHAQSGAKVVIEEYLDGPEVSFFVVTDGESALPLLPAQDFKRVGDGDTGPNTGGMGAYAPLPWVPPGLTDIVMSTVVHPTLAELRARGTPFAGLLYVGLALTPAGPRVVEFNARLGDPDGQAVLALLDTPLAGLLYAAATGRLGGHPPLRWRDGACVVVVVAAQGYPGAPRTGDLIAGDWMSGVDAAGVLQAGTRVRADGALVSAGGRVLNCTGIGPDLVEARERAYALVERIKIDGAHYRRDIAQAACEGRVHAPQGWYGWSSATTAASPGGSSRPESSPNS